MAQFPHFTGLLPALLTVRRHQPDGQPGLVDDEGSTALIIGGSLTAQLRILLSKQRQPLSQTGVVGADAGDVLQLIEQVDLWNCYARSRSLFIALEVGDTLHFLHQPDTQRKAIL